jgi:charged multivesicular body protein 1
MANKEQELVFQLKFQARMLEKNSQRELKTAEKERKLAQQFLKKGQRPLALLHAQNCTRATQMSQFLAENSGRVQAMACDVQMAQVQKDMAKQLSAATKEMEKYVSQMNLQKMAETAMKYDQLKGKTETAQQLLVPDDATLQMNADALLCDLEQELEQEMLVAPLDIPSAAAVPTGPALAATPV